MPYYSLNVQVTLRCNAFCRNCIKFCNMEDVTGLDSSHTDLTLDQVALLAEELRRMAKRKREPVATFLCLTGGEATIHPQIIGIVRLLEPLVSEGVVGGLQIDSNLRHRVPEIDRYVKNYSTPEQNSAIHNTVLLHPDEIEGRRPSFSSCRHYRKWWPVLNVYGYSMCCAADAYIRLFCLDDLVLAHLPDEPEGFPIDKMDAVCQHCPFGCERQVFERDLGRPVSEIYRREAELNRTGRELVHRYGL